MNLRSTLIRTSVATACAALATVALAQDKAPAGDAKARMATEAAFTKADANGDGKLSKDEAAKLPAIAAKFETLDKDKDGALTLAEFAAGYTAAG
jgi:Ca2+-binding EF-hand superfamily protein